jgi:type IV pilus assembly protein PilM
MARAKGAKSHADEVVAVDVGVRVTKAVHLRRRDDTLVLAGYLLTPTPRPATAGESGLSTTALAEHLRSVVRQLKTSCRRLALTLAHETVLLSHTELPQTAPADLRKMIRLSPKAYLQQDLPGHVFDVFWRRPPGATDTAFTRRRRSRVMVAAARRSVVDAALAAARAAGLQLVALTPVAVALTNAFRLVRDDSHPDAAALLDLGATHSTITIVQQGDVLLTRTVSLGSDNFSDVLSVGDGTSAGSGPEPMPPELMQSALQKAILTFAREVDASAGFFTSQFERHIGQLFVSGGTARSQMVLQMLESELSFSCESWNLVRHLAVE